MNERSFWRSDTRVRRSLPVRLAGVGRGPNIHDVEVVSMKRGERAFKSRPRRSIRGLNV